MAKVKKRKAADTVDLGRLPNGDVRVEKQSFLRALEMCEPGLSGKEIVQQSSSFAFLNGRVHTFNQEIAVSAPVPEMPPEFEGAAQARPLLEILRKMSEPVLTLSAKEGELVVRGRNGRAVGIRMEPKVTLEIHTVDEPAAWRPVAEKFMDAVIAVVDCAGSDETRPKYTRVNVAPGWLEATDNYQLGRFLCETGAAAPYLVRADSLRYAPGYAMTEIGETRNWLHLRNKDGAKLSLRRHEQEYFDLSPFLKVEGAKISIPKAIGPAVAKAEVFAKQNADAKKQVKVTLSPAGPKGEPGKKNLVLYGEGATGWYREPFDVDYKGEPVSFMVSPAILKTIAEKFSTCVVSPKLKIKVTAGDNKEYVYVSALEPEANPVAPRKGRKEEAD